MVLPASNAGTICPLANDQGNYTAQTPPARRAGDAQARRTVRHFTTLLAGTNVIALIDIAILLIIAVTSVAASHAAYPFLWQ